MGVNRPMSVNKNVSTIIDPSSSINSPFHENKEFSYASEAYQKVLDYRVAEILLSAIVLAVITVLRLHH